MLTARNSDSLGIGEDGFAAAEGTIELPPVGDTENIRYAIKSITLSDKMTLVDAAMNLETGTWITSGPDVSAELDKARIRNTPASTLGFVMGQNTGKTEVVSNVITDQTAGTDNSNSING